MISRKTSSFRQGLFESRGQILAVGILAPIVGAVLTCCAASVWPIRLDYRALQDLRKLEGLGLPQSSGRFVFLSSDNSIASARTATFALQQLAFPNGSVFWATLKEKDSGPWTSRFIAVDSLGKTYRLSPDSDAGASANWIPDTEREEEARRMMDNSYIVADGPLTLAAFEERWPFVKSAGRITVLPTSPAPSGVRRRFANELTVTHCVRISAVLGGYFATFFLLIQLPFLRQRSAAFSLAAALFAWLAGLLWVSYLLQLANPAVARWTSLVLWASLLVAAELVNWTSAKGNSIAVSSVLSRDTKAGFLDASRATTTSPVEESRHWGKTEYAALGFCAVAFALLFLARLDFDGDFFNNWLPQARFYYLLGRHDPAILMAQGLSQAATYPPGYGITLSTIMWMTGMKPAESFLLGRDTTFAILIYRCLVCAMNGGLFVLVAAYLRKYGSASAGLWAGVLLITMLLIPSTAGQHIAAETILFPMLGASLVLVAMGRRFGDASLILIGLWAGGAGTLIKWEAAPIFVLGVLPWLAPNGLDSSVPVPFTAKKWKNWRLAAPLAMVLVSMLPTFIWKATLRVRNGFFAPVTWPRLTASIHHFPALAASAGRLMLEDGRLLLFLFALPCAVLYQLRRAPRIWTVAVPVSAVSLLAVWVAVFLFSNLPAQTYLNTSYTRLTMLPTFSALLYCAGACVSTAVSSGKASVSRAKVHRVGSV
ncbi:MAG TPA: hypothetical protein VJX67_06975 [Blastocatellia bacterium]|nr:hypothetical protein [Blastocatellia bacterium]